MKYADTKVVFREVPDEITLAVNISGCPVGCKGCHSPYLSEDIGQPLDASSLEALIEANSGISCVSLMGGDADPAFVAELCRGVKNSHPALKTCWYSGRGLDRAGEVLPWLDYIKVGPWVEECGPLDSPTTNQRFYAVLHDGPGGPVPSSSFSTGLGRPCEAGTASPAIPALPVGICLEDRTARFRRKLI